MYFSAQQEKFQTSTNINNLQAFLSKPCWMFYNVCPKHSYMYMLLEYRYMQATGDLLSIAGAGYMHTYMQETSVIRIRAHTFFLVLLLHNTHTRQVYMFINPAIPTCFYSFLSCLLYLFGMLPLIYWLVFEALPNICTSSNPTLYFRN